MSAASQAQRDDLIGEALPGGYRIERFLASGGFAWIYLAHDKQKRPCAVKVPYQITRETLKLFQREIKILRALPPSPYRVAYIGDGLTFKGVPFLAMEWVDGPTLSHVLAQSPVWTIEDACNFALQLCAACADLHHLGIADRDLKPENILLTHEWQVKLVDFGLIKDAQGLLKLLEAEDILAGKHFAENLETGMLAGSPEWIAPEQFADAASGDDSLAQTDTWTDVYALGLLLYRLLTGRVLFPFRSNAKDQAGYARDLLTYLNERATIRDAQIQRPAEIPEALWSVVSRALRSDPKRRQHDAIELGHEIEHYLMTGEEVNVFDDEKTTLGNAAAFMATYSKPRSVPPSDRPRPMPAKPPSDFAPFGGDESADATAIAQYDELVAHHPAAPGYPAMRPPHLPLPPPPPVDAPMSPAAAHLPPPSESIRVAAAGGAPAPWPAMGPGAPEPPVGAPPSLAPGSSGTSIVVLLVLAVLGLLAIGAVGALLYTLSRV